LVARTAIDGQLRDCYLVATAERPGTEVLETLRANFKEGPRTESPSKVYRFFDEHALIAIRQHSENPTAEWIVDADSREALYERTELIWPYHGLAPSFRL
jgi:hypothetical protein